MPRIVTFGEVMMRLSPPAHARFVQATQLDLTFGGGEANVALSLAEMGFEAAHVTCFPDHALGHAAASFLRKHKLDTSPIRFEGKRLGTYYVESGASFRASKVIYDREYSAFAQLNPASFDWEAILQRADWFHFTGISPAISEAAAQACLDAVRAANRLGVPVSADVGYRSNLWQYGKAPHEVMPALVEGCEVVVCSKGDAHDMFGIVPLSKDDEGDFASISRQLIERFPRVRHVLNTTRKTLSASSNVLRGFLYDGQTLHKSKRYTISPIVDRIGGGDAFMAGYIYGYLNDFSAQKTLEFAVAASVLKHTIEGDFNLASIEEINSLLAGEVGKLRR